MSNCVQCGRELPSFSVGATSDGCPECRKQAAVEMSGHPASGRPTTLEIARRFPITSGLIVVNILIYLICAAATLKAHQGSVLDFDPRLLLGWGADFGPLTLDKQWWRVLTSMFLHGGLIHVAANMWCLWSLGRLAERIYGRYRYLAIYLLTGLGSAVASLAVHPTTISVGASGAIFGVVGSLVFPIYRNRALLPGPAMRNVMSSLAMFIIVNLAIGSAIPVIDNAAHVGGLLAGLALGAIITQFAISGAYLQALFPKVAVSTLLVIGFGFAGVQYWNRDEILPQQAYLWLDLARYDKAMESAQRAVARDPKSALAHVAMGDVLYRRAQYSEAVKEYETTHVLDPTDGYGAGRLGLAFVAVGRMQEAEPLLRQAVKDDPDDATLLQSLGIALAAEGKLDEAATYLKQAVQKKPNLATAQYALGLALFDQEKYEEAITPLREAVRLQSDNEEYKRTLSQAEANAGNAK